ncbi:Acetyltransferase (GNAT) family protein [Roseovarius tolerans]|uniref:Acetyltransferase (GNAT) family protein n=1 Tax=Roseovarius tolerans TaxID=74031 RepID=A0A1H7ZZ64_9RHOB|nr:N-acetyltransferase [Roseovarius tolerans]SEM63745.1 Acetyltransferase (GNAT) family protein [Roseovarius tolerans]
MGTEFRAVTSEADMGLLDRALRSLSHDLGDQHMAGLGALRAGLMGDTPAAYGLLAVERDVIGAALYSPVFSTAQGAPGVYVSDLWVDAATRGQGAGRHLLAEVARRAGAQWGAAWMTLAVYGHSTASRRFYERLGFAPQERVTQMRLPQAGFDRLKGEGR